MGNNDLPEFDAVLSETSETAKMNVSLQIAIEDAKIQLGFALHYMESRSYLMPEKGMDKPICFVKQAIKTLTL